MGKHKTKQADGKQADGKQADGKQVQTIDALVDALHAAQPGDVIDLAPGIYRVSDVSNSKLRGSAEAGKPKKGATQQDHGLVYRVRGTADRWITIQGPATAVIDGGDKNSALSMVECSYVRVCGLTVQGGKKPVDVQACDHVELTKLTARDAEQCAIRIRDASSFVTVRECTADDTGHDNPANGEGVYVGTAEGHGFKDLTHDVLITGCAFGPKIRSENVDLKANTTKCVVENNRFNGAGHALANASKALVSTKGDDHVVRHNAVAGLKPGGKVWDDQGRRNIFVE